MLTELLRLPNDTSSAAGWYKLEYIIPAWLASFTLPLSGVWMPEWPTLAFGSWMQLDFTLRTLDFGDEVKQTEHGNVHAIKIAGFIPRTDGAAMNLMNQMALYEEFIVRIKDNEGYTRIVGTPAETLKFTYKEGNSGGPGTRKGIWFEFADDFSRPALFLI